MKKQPDLQNNARFSCLSKFQGLYNSAYEHDSCGLGFIANIQGRASHKIVQDGLQILENLTHRGAVGADPLMGDGAGILIQIPHVFFQSVCEFDLPAPGYYAVAFVFMPQDPETRKKFEEMVENVIIRNGQTILGWRDVPCNNAGLSQTVIESEPVSRQLFIGRGSDIADEAAFERKLYLMRKILSNLIYDANHGAEDTDFYVVSMSACTLVYKGIFLADQLGRYYLDLQDPRFESALALVHQRFSTNTFPSWRMAHPYRMVAHNGEINTLRGNVNWMAARQASVETRLFGKDISKLWPISYEGQSDTACFDNALEFLVMGGYDLAHAMMMLVPEAWSDNPLMSEERRAFYAYHAALMEPWDGPAAIAFSDGKQIGATLDRNGLRPARVVVTKDGHVIMASEVGVLPLEESQIAEKWRLQPGKMLLIDLKERRIISDDELKNRFVQAHPFTEWLARTQIVLEDLPPIAGGLRSTHTAASLLDCQQAFGYTQEDLNILMAPMATTGQENIGSMGTDTPLSALSSQPKLLYTYFKQNFAQVTNPPIDPIREEIVMSLVSFIGPRPNLFDLEGLSEHKRLEVRQPILTNEDLEKVRLIGDIADNQFQTQTLDMTYNIAKGADGMEAAIDRLCERAERAVQMGYNIIILSDRLLSAERMAIPALLATSAVHHHLIRKGLRTSVGLVVETGEAREVHHFCVLAGYGAEAINPYLAFETLSEMRMRGAFPQEVTADEVKTRYIKSINKGLLKVMSKMGISTFQSYCGAQIFDAVGLSSGFIKRFFFGTASQIEGVGLKEIAQETLTRHKAAFGHDPVLRDNLEVGGEYNYRMRGEAHAWTPDAVAKLQHAVRGENVSDYQEYAAAMNTQNEALMTLRGLFSIRMAEDMGISPIPIEDVEPAAQIVKRFSTGAMSFGSISAEAHTTLAKAMNRLGGKSNTGEGGEETERFLPLPDGRPNPNRSAIKQVASGRFGVTTEYLVNADMIQIKVAQGAKPGEGGQLPGHKVDAVIAKVRHSTPRVGLISPPPHHDIYSIEDLAQLIFDLKNVNPQADISVKLVSEVGVGTIAAGVAKARADHITISGFEGGTGASPLTSIKHAGSPWELGLAETHQTLVMNGLRTRVALQVDGGLRTGRDVIIGALLGADEFGFSTAPLIAAGCLMMRKCHLNTCPVGIATQDPVLRQRFRGTPEHIINYFFFVAEEVRQFMAAMGVQRFEELVGQPDRLDRNRAIKHWKSLGLDFSKLFFKPDVPRDAVYHNQRQDHKLDHILDRQLIAESKVALDEKTPVQITTDIRNVNRSVGAMLSGEVAKRYGCKGLPEDTISIQLRGTAGQSFGAFATRGLFFDLQGDANDYVGKGLSGGRLVVRPGENSNIVAEDSIIVGNTVLYGAIEGEAYFCGQAGERFAVRNSGAIAVVEGVGDHGCEYMTGGVVVVLGPTGRNFAAGMSGGVAYILDKDETFATRCNLAMVDLEPVPEEDDLLEKLHHHGGDIEHHGRVDVSTNMTSHDEERLYTLISSHMHYTNSEKAKRILDNWKDMRPQFVKVMPVDYRRALLNMQQERQALAPSDKTSANTGGGVWEK